MSIKGDEIANTQQILRLIFVSYREMLLIENVSYRESLLYFNEVENQYCIRLPIPKG